MAGLSLNNSNSNYIEYNDLQSNGHYGISFKYTSGNQFDNNTSCSNTLSDIKIIDFSSIGSNPGDNNTCCESSDWDDVGTIGCTYRCTSSGGFTCGCTYDLNAPPSQRCVGWYQWNYGYSFSNPSTGVNLSYGDCWSWDGDCSKHYGNYKETFSSCEVCRGHPKLDWTAPLQFSLAAVVKGPVTA